MKKTSGKAPVSLVEISMLRQHEMIDKSHMESIKDRIIKAGCFKEPIIIDRENFVVLDGHHRLNSCKSLGLSKIPCLMVDYIKDCKIKVRSRRKGIIITKEIVIDNAKKKKLFPSKTTRHFIPGRVKGMKIPLSLLA